MTSDSLSKHFKGIAVKRLSAVEAHPEKSHQHEFNGVAGLKQLFGIEGPKRYPARFVWLCDDDYDLSTSEGFVTWYDARENHPTRSEHRLYFPATSVTEKAAEGDSVLVGRLLDDTVLIVVAAACSSAESQLLWLFNAKTAGNQFVFREFANETDKPLGTAAAFLLDQIGVTPKTGDEELLAEMVSRFERGFPATQEFSEFARRTAGRVDPVQNPDNALVAYMEHEEKLFRMFERFLLSERLETGFMKSGGPDVDGFVEFSLSVQNRRKSRAGRALENHAAHVLELNGITFSRNSITENRSRPDFLFPGAAAYQDLSFPSERLTMLAAKSTCKDRWRQILAEAERIQPKHLLTLEPSISKQQTDEMAAHKVQLVVPASLQETFSDRQRTTLQSFEDFISSLKLRQ